MGVQCVIDVDLAEVYASEEKREKEFIRTLEWGDGVEVENVTDEYVEIKTVRHEIQADGSIKPVPVPGFIVPSASSQIKPEEVAVEKEKSRVLRINFVDVQQGDASVIETAKGKVILIDGGDNQLFARYLANRFRGSSEGMPKEIECVLVTHGDADHFVGLVKIEESETHKTEWKRLFIRPKRVYHNGLVKRPSDVREAASFGRTVTDDDGTTIVTELETDLLKVDDAKMNEPFRRWKKALKNFEKRGPIEVRRLAKGDDDAFDFLADEGIRVEVLGPIPTRVGNEEGLKYLGNPQKGPRVGHHSLDSGRKRFTGKSASHTINGHSVVFKLSYGDFSFLFAGDLNEEAELELVRAHENLRSEVLKVPHHGSHDFLPEFIEAASPLVSVVSSGDESARKEYIHPWATLIGALGKYSRTAEPLIFVTELVAFFAAEGWTRPEFHKLGRGDGVALVDEGKTVVNEEARGPFFAFERTAYGQVKVRTDGERLLVCTDSGQADLKEAYAYRMDDAGEPVPEQVRKA
jgi:beta-lactamase superfamily II metal-dependent hydrolase